MLIIIFINFSHVIPVNEPERESSKISGAVIVTNA